MNLEEANNLLSQICALNKLFFEEHLGIRWELPDLNILMDSNLENLQISSRIQHSITRDDVEKEASRNINEKDDWKFIQNVFETIVSSMDYMIDEDLPKVFELCNMTQEEQKIAQLANIFSVSRLRRNTKFGAFFE